MGTPDYPWSGIAASYVYQHVSGGLLGYTTHTFDEYDDLAYAKNYTTVKDGEGHFIDFQKSFPFLIDENGCMHLGDAFGYLVGCVKALTNKQDEHRAQFEALLSQIEELCAQVSQLKQTRNN